MRRFPAALIVLVLLAWALAGCAREQAPQPAVVPATPVDEPSPIVDPADPPVPKPIPASERGPIVRYGAPRQPLVIDALEPFITADCCIQDDDPLDACRPNCEQYRSTKLRRERTPWHATPVRNGRATVTVPGNQCNGAPTEVVVRGIRVDVYRYYAVDPVPDDHLGVDGCTLALHPCEGETCERVTVDIDAPDGTRLNHAGQRELRLPCRPFPGCQRVKAVPPPATGLEEAAHAANG